MVDSYDEWSHAKHAAEPDGSVGAVVLDGKVRYFTYANDDEAAAKAFELKHGRPYGEPEATAKAVLDEIRPGWDQASLADLVEALA
jgi:tellurite resistance-related uncharacterized protein